MFKVKRIISMLQIAAITVGLAATVTVVTPQPAEAKVCLYGICAYVGGWIQDGCYDNNHWSCVTIYPSPR